ncbi:MAG TPA: hypothetical protein VGO47_13320 [Chlamydiales bacterium]|nr:hypothetical protein [Chlamydiales bacterium]
MEFFEGKVLEDEEIIRILPFLALPDGAHLVGLFSCLFDLHFFLTVPTLLASQSNEDYSYFHLVPSGPKPTTVFGVS